MGKASKLFKGERRMGLYLLGALCAALGALFVGVSVFGAESAPVEKAVAPAVASAPEPLVNEALVEARARIEGHAARRAAEEEAARQARAEAARKEAAEAKEAAEEEAAREETQERTASRAAAEPAAPVAPADTTMYLSVPKIGIYDIPVVEGTTEASLTAGAGHLTGSGYPWVEGSNTYIAGHRLGYAGTPSDHVFYDLPNLVAGDEILLTDSNGKTYTYAVSEILEVPTTDLSVTYPVAGRDIVSLQTCIEDFGDYWTEGPNWLARYVVRADRVD